MGNLGRRAGSRHFRHCHEGIDGERVERLDFDLAGAGISYKFGGSPI
jgi:hypothetical protein